MKEKIIYKKRMKNNESKLVEAPNRYVLKIGDSFVPEIGGYVKITNIEVMYTGGGYEALIHFNFTDTKGKRGKSKESVTSFAKNYID